MELVNAVILGAALGVGLKVMGLASLRWVAEALSVLVGGFRPDPWPRGVQEEDRDRPWGRRSGAEDPEPQLRAPALQRVHPITQRR